MSVREVIDSFRGQYRFLSNFHPATVKLDGITYKSVENAYQAAKNFDRDRRLLLVGLTANKAKINGQDPSLIKRPDWDNVKVIVMTDLVRQKFTNHEDLKKQLLDTGDAELIEGNTWGDVFWGVCKGKGENNLGKILMDIRKELTNA